MPISPKPELLANYLHAKRYGVRVLAWMTINTHYRVRIVGWATHCSIGPKGGRYVHFICEDLRERKHDFTSIDFDHDWNKEREFKLENKN